MKDNLLEFTLNESHNWLAKLKSLLEVDEYNIDLKQRLKIYETIIAQVFQAISCSIILFNKSELKKLNTFTYPDKDISPKINSELENLLGSITNGASY